MNLRQSLLALATAALGLTASGCVMHARTLETTRFGLERELPGARFDSELQLKLGRVSLGLVRRLASLADDEDVEELGILRDIRRVELAVYRTESLPSIRETAFAIPRERNLRKKGWKTAVRAVSADSASWVLFLEQQGEIRGLLVGALDDDELVLVKIHGDIQGIFERLMEEHVLDLPGVVRADLEPGEGEPIAVVEPR